MRQARSPEKPVLRAAAPKDIAVLARLWHEGWQDAHALILPEDLARHRTLDSFRPRLGAGLPCARVACVAGSPVGFCMTRRDELYQLYVGRDARGSGVAAALIRDAEHLMAARGVQTAWLACAIGNARAEAFYHRMGWRRSGEMISDLDTPDGIFRLRVWRYEKTLA
jgi:GNAT superfamily N-acetyltransferase